MVSFCISDSAVSEHLELPLFHSDGHVSNSTGQDTNRFAPTNIFVTLFGRLENGDSIAVVINNWRFHFFVELSDDQSHVFKLEPLLNSLKSRLRNAQFEFVRRHKAVGFYGDESGTRLLFNFLKVSFSSFRDGYHAKKYLTDSGFQIHEWDSFVSHHRSIFIVGQLMEYLTLKAGTPETPCSWFSWIDVDVPFTPGKVAPFTPKYTHCKHELIVRHEKLFLCPPSMLIPQIRMLSFDIECYSPDDSVFPVATSCPVIAIGNSVYKFDPCGSSGFVQEICFSFNPVATVPLTTTVESSTIDKVERTFEMRVFSSELAMLEAWRDFVVFGDFDVLTGYNIWKFDNPYLMDRVKVLAPSGSRFFRLSKIMRHSIDSTRRAKPQTCSSTAMGDNDIILFNAPGLAEIDVFMLTKRLKGMTSLKLKDVSATEIGSTKFDLLYTEMNVAYRAGNSRLIAEYCQQDTRLPALLIEKWRSLREFIELSRATYTPIMALSSCGQQIKVRNMYFQMGHAMNFVFNSHKFINGEYQGAIVITPKPGYYTFPVATLDFASLYPSCMMKDNLCPSTLLIGDDATKTFSHPTVQLLNHRFVQEATGIVPELLRNLLGARAVAKRMMGEAKRNNRPAHEIAQFDYRQLSLKLCANSVYGFFNTEGMYKCMAVAESTTCSGRYAIERAVFIAQSPEYNCEVIYGDTDSIMIRIPGATTVEQASSYAINVAAAVTNSFDGKLSLVFEKVFLPYLLVKKKRYAGQMYTSPTDPPKLDYKGFELVRRDSFPLCHDLQRNVFDILIAPVPENAGCLVQLAENRRSAVVLYLNEIMNLFLNRSIDINRLVISKSLKRTYANPGGIIQAVVNDQIKAVTPGREFPPGDRVPFIIVYGDACFQPGKAPTIRSRSTNIAKRAVYFEFVLKYDIFMENIDYIYYLGRLKPTVIQIMEFVSLAKLPEITGMFDSTTDKLRRLMRTFADCTHRDIDSFFGPTPTAVPVGYQEPPVRIVVEPSLSLTNKRKLPSSSSSSMGSRAPSAKKPTFRAITSFLVKTEN